MTHKISLNYSYHDIASIENLLEAWKEFKKGKKSKKDVQDFEFKLMENIISLHNDLVSKTYKHSDYYPFNISDPKPRNIHKASVRDRLLHHAIYRILYPFFDRTFIADSYSCRINKGTHKAVNCFKEFAYRVSKNNTKTCWILKCDIKKFFASIDHDILKKILQEYIPDEQILWLLNQIIDSFHSTKPAVGLPLGNLTSQLLVNIFMNKFDHFVKHKLKAKYYIRYADDFVFLSKDRQELENLIPKINNFLNEQLKLSLHPDKVYIKTFASGVDFLGWINFTVHRVLRTTTKRRMFNKLKYDKRQQVLSSYLGLLGHGNTHKIKDILRCFSFRV